MKTTDFNFELPESLIAQTPLENRSSSRLLMLKRSDGTIRHKSFCDIVNELRSGDCLVLNETRVIPARLRGHRKSGAKVELLLLNRLDANRWEALAGPGKKAKPGDEIFFDTGDMKAVIESIVTDSGMRIVRFEYEGVFEERLNELGEMPLPPYIKEKLTDRERYQTIYAKNDGSVAAPTAGLHFTDEVLKALSDKGVKIAAITLHVGLGTFRPVTAVNIDEHIMHSEYYNIDSAQAQVINSTRRNGGRIIAVGTTSCRTLEACTNADGELISGAGWTDIFIYPGYKFKLVDGLITNFHLPGSTLIMLVSALAGRENILNAYNKAVESGYRFYSFGDCMAIL